MTVQSNTKVSIVLASYNGEKFIRQQLYSLMVQTFSDFICYIHDDGSSDDTVRIIKDTIKEDDRFTLIEDGLTFGHPGSNFLHLLKFVNTEFCCFCDQDDLWLDTKLERLYSQIVKDINETEQGEQNKPIMLIGNAYIWDYNKNNIFGRSALYFPYKIKDYLFLNGGIQGASTIFNKACYPYLLNKLDIDILHDQYLSLIALTFGHVFSIDEPLMLYRQHEGNWTFAAAGTFKNKYKNLTKSKAPVVFASIYDAVDCFYRKYEQEITNCTTKHCFQSYLKMRGYSNIDRFFSILSNRYTLYGSKIKLIIKILCRPYFGKNA
jgi:glycosyltransferase involved in cell wall biosynthesis